VTGEADERLASAPDTLLLANLDGNPATPREKGPEVIEQGWIVDADADAHALDGQLTAAAQPT
jgi:hypothetical protein